MTIGDVFARAWDLWRRSVGWLILAGLLVGVIMAAFSWVLGKLLVAAGLSSALLLMGSSSSVPGRGASALAIVMALVGGFLYYAVALTFYGGMFEMVIGAYRRKLPVEFADLFSGFRHIGAYALFAVTLTVVFVLLGFLNYIPFGFIIATVVWVWLVISWMYVVPLIADHAIGFREAAARSMRAVKDAGWWWTFFMVLLLGLAMLLVIGMIAVVAWVLRGSGAASVGAVYVLGIAFAVLVPPYVICYVSVLYISSGAEIGAERVKTGGQAGYAPGPPAPPAFGAPAAPAVAGQAAGGYGAAVPRQGDDDAWKAAADPLAGQAPPPPLASPASGGPSAMAPGRTTAPPTPARPRLRRRPPRARVCRRARLSRLRQAGEVSREAAASALPASRSFSALRPAPGRARRVPLGARLQDAAPGHRVGGATASTILTKESAHGACVTARYQSRPARATHVMSWLATSPAAGSTWPRRAWSSRAEAPPPGVCSHVRREAARDTPGGGGRWRPAGEGPRPSPRTLRRARELCAGPPVAGPQSPSAVPCAARARRAGPPGPSPRRRPRGCAGGARASCAAWRGSPVRRGRTPGARRRPSCTRGTAPPTRVRVSCGCRLARMAVTSSHRRSVVLEPCQSRP